MTNRRTFVGAGLATAALGANDRITLGLIGGRNQGRHVAVAALKAGAQIKTFCDLDPAILDQRGSELEKLQGKPLARVKDYRTVLDDKDIDAVIIGTPDHWHVTPTILACQAGKDVYIEKPLSQTIHEGHLMREAARKYNRVMQVGTQRRSMPHFRAAAEYAASGKLGKICLIRTWICQVRGDLGKPADGTPPPGVDYDVWLGNAPKRPFNPLRFHYNWRFFWDYGNTELGNQGVHMLDVAMLGIQKMRGLENCLPTHISGNSGIYWLKDAKEVPDTQTMNYDYGDFMLTWELHSFQDKHPIEGTGAGTAFYGTEGTLIADGRGWRVPAQGIQHPAGEQGLVPHLANFFECMRSRKRPNADVEIGRLSTTLTHLGNICTRLGRDVRFDPKTETFGSDKQANALLTKQYRAPYTLPKV